MSSVCHLAANPLSHHAAARPLAIFSGHITKLHPWASPRQRLDNLQRHFSTPTAFMAPTAKSYDYIVIGGGSGGSGAARRASGWYKAKTCIIENGISGGCCVNVGCVPKKMTYNFASINETLKHAKHYGYDVPSDIPFDYGSFVDKRTAKIKTLNGMYETNWAKEGIDLIQGTAKFLSEKEIEVDLNDGAGKTRVTAPHICIASGGFPIKPKDIKGAEYGITSDDFFKIKKLPKKIVFVGAGYISVELAGMMNTMGVETHMFIRGETFLRKFDPMVQHTLTSLYEQKGVIIHKKHPGIKEVVQLQEASSESDPSSKQLKLICNDGSEVVCNELLWAIGRSPEIQDMDLSPLSMKMSSSGHIWVDEYQNTSIPGIYAIGDVTGQAELTPVAIAAGRLLGNRLFGPAEHKNAKLDYDRIPTVVFGEPNVGTTGLTEPQAAEKYGSDKVKVYHTRFKGMYFDMFPDEERNKHPTEYKLITVGEDEEIVGMHLIGNDVSEAMQAWGVVVKMGGKKRDLDSCVAIHPTSAEELVTLK